MSRVAALSVVGLATCALIVPGAPADPGGYAPEEAPATGGEGTLLSRHHALLGEALRFKGTVATRFAGAPVLLQLRVGNGPWDEVARTVAAADGSFAVRWTTNHIGRFSLRATPSPTDGSAATATATATPARDVTVYRAGTATVFGPGLYGRHTACGQRLTHRLRGIAHRTLPCGTLVDVLYRGRSLTVPVVDHGPYGEQATWDLTTATARDLRFRETATIGAVRQRTAAPVTERP